MYVRAHLVQTVSACLKPRNSTCAPRFYLVGVFPAAYEHGVSHSHAGAGGNGGNGGAVSQMSSTDQAGLKSAGKEIAGCCYAFLTNPFSD